MLRRETEIILQELNVNLSSYRGLDRAAKMQVKSPINGEIIASIGADTESNVNKKIADSQDIFDIWRKIPAPKRGRLIGILGENLRKYKKPLGKLVTIECGKILEEGLGEVQEMIDICEFAVGLSRQIGGLTLPSERTEHVMHENWHPLGVVGVISAFNFPVAVWSWNTALAIICGNSVIWKPSDKTPLTAIACNAIFLESLKRFEEEFHYELSEIEAFNRLKQENTENSPNDLPVLAKLSQLAIGFADIGEQIVKDHRISLVSATGSSYMGSMVAPIVAKRFGKSLLELGGNNAAITTKSANLDIAIPSILFGAVGTAGQRCTSTRRLFVHKSIYKPVFKRLSKAYKQIEKKIGNPLEENTLIGPLIDEASFKNMQNSLSIAKYHKAEVTGGKRFFEKEHPDAYYVSPALVKIPNQIDIVKQETFAPILYMIPYDTLEEAIEMQNDVAQGLSSAIFTENITEAEIFKQNSDCGIANVNIGTSGAEIGGAFGGEKETGGGRESGSDSWKAYMRRQTSTSYYGKNPPMLAQGIKFDG